MVRPATPYGTALIWPEPRATQRLPPGPAVVGAGSPPQLQDGDEDAGSKHAASRSFHANGGFPRSGAWSTCPTASRYQSRQTLNVQPSDSMARHSDTMYDTGKDAPIRHTAAAPPSKHLKFRRGTPSAKNRFLSLPNSSGPLQGYAALTQGAGLDSDTRLPAPRLGRKSRCTAGGGVETHLLAYDGSAWR
ncbi:hypothetical protein ACCO45_010700 [Purpureocillium lilacinum]|uniref:Uncharacterized protein n=1 Tax=Purpureocillium lilacinum TaxID=33203 RepID=A0ACC4DG80_PURLI